MIHNDRNFDRDENELQEFLVFAMATAGKTAAKVLEKVNLFSEEVDPNGDGLLSACGQLDQLGMLESVVRKFKLGNYKRFVRFVREALRKGLDLTTCTIEDLEGLYGIGPKTARFFIGFNRPNQRFAVLDCKCPA